jgi:phosphate transport system permease protein
MKHMSFAGAVAQGAAPSFDSPRSPDSDVPIRPADNPTFGDRIFRGVCIVAASIALVIIGATVIFLVNKARPALAKAGIWKFFTGSVWNAGAGRFGVLGLLLGTIIIAIVALVTAVPFAVGMALFVNEYAPPKLARALTAVIDLLAAVPSLLFGMWGWYAFKNHVLPESRWISEHLVAIPFFRVSKSAAEPNYSGSSFIAGLVVAMMIIPIVTSVSRDVMARAPREQCEGALALGASRWAMIRDVILPYGKSGIVGATMLGFGRALGETVAVAIVLQGIVYKVNTHVVEHGGGSIAANIFVRFGEASKLELSALVGSGLALMVLTFGVGLTARRIVARTTRFS